MKIVFRSAVISSLIVLGGCSWLTGEDGFFNNTEFDYTRAKMTSELQIPSNVGESNVQDHYLVPELADDISGVIFGVDNDAMAPMQVLTLGSKVRANRDSKVSSVFVTSTEIQLWDSVERYLVQESIPISRKDLNAGTIHTDWVVKKDDSFWWGGDISGWRYRYLISLEPAERPTENTLSVELLEVEELLAKTGQWQTVADKGRKETELLNSLLGFIYVEDISKSRQLVNQSALGGIIVTLGSDANDNPALITSADFEHVWVRLPISLKLLNVIIEDQDRTQGLFFIEMPEDKGFLSSLKFWSSDDENSLGFPNKSYRVHIAKLGENISITFLDDENTPIEASLLANKFPRLAKAFKSRAADSH